VIALTNPVHRTPLLPMLGKTLAARSWSASNHLPHPHLVAVLFPGHLCIASMCPPKEYPPCTPASVFQNIPLLLRIRRFGKWCSPVADFSAGACEGRRGRGGRGGQAGLHHDQLIYRELAMLLSYTEYTLHRRQSPRTRQ
jgi:hypothetical protein